MSGPVRITVILVKLDSGHGARTESRTERAARSTHHGLKPRLNAHGVGIDAGLKLLGHGVKCLGKALAGTFGSEHVRYRVEVDIHKQVSRQTANVTDFQQHFAGQFALDAEVDHIRASDAILGIETRVAVLEYAIGVGRARREGPVTRTPQTR